MNLCMNGRFQQDTEIFFKDLVYNNPMEQFIIPNPRLRFASLLLINIILLIASLFLLAQSYVRSSPSAPLGWLVVFVLLAITPWFIRQILDTRPYLIVDERGLWYRPSGVDFIPWDAIKDITLKSIIGTKVICLELDQEELWLARLGTVHQLIAQINKAMGFPLFSLNLSRIGVQVDEVFDRITAIRMHWQERSSR